MSIENIWAVTGLLLIIADVVFGTFFMLFLGGAALITGLLVWMGVMPNPTVQWIVFAAISVLSVVLFRKKLVAAFGKDAKDKYVEHEGQKVHVVVDIPENGEGKVNYRGAQWIAKSQSGQAIAAGTTVTIARLDGITVIVTEN